MSEEKKESAGMPKTGVYMPAWRGYWAHLLFMFLVFVLAVVVTVKSEFKAWVWILAVIVMLAVFLYVVWKRMEVRLHVRDDEVELESGIMRRHSVEISYQSIQTVQVDQSFFQRMLNIGNISIASSGTSGFEIKNVENVYDPRTLRNNIQYFERMAKGSAPAPAAAPAAPQA